MRTGIVILALAVMAGRPAAAQTPEPLALGSDAVKTVAGNWDLMVPRNNLKCRIQLSVSSGRYAKATVGMPPACRKSLGAMGNAQGWQLLSNGAVRMAGAKGDTIGDFSRADTGVLKAQVGANEFTMEPVTGRYPSQERVASVDAAMQRLTTPTADNVTTPIAMAGRYQLIRANNAETGCVLLLDRNLPGPVSQSGKASIEKGCADKGLLTFDPAGWIVERDRMFLYARKGHRTGFNIERGGQLIKDPPAGAPLSARKL
ncbi:MAG: AprI/Inh family metalloprotease inhibitor [Beijerinckiaceae bacterium]